MRKSDRIRILELEMVRLQMEVELLQSTIHNILEAYMSKAELDAGKWYNRKPYREND